RRRHTRSKRDWSSDVCSSDLILGAVAPEQDSSSIQREVFFNIPSAMRAIFYAGLPVVFVAIAWLFARRMQNWERGQPDARGTTRSEERRVGKERSVGGASAAC